MRFPHEEALHQVSSTLSLHLPLPWGRPLLKKIPTKTAHWGGLVNRQKNRRGALRSSKIPLKSYNQQLIDIGNVGQFYRYVNNKIIAKQVSV